MKKIAVKPDIDRSHWERLKPIVDAADGSAKIPYDKIFTSERVVETISSEKILLNGFKPERVKAMLPFTPVVYAPICQECVNPKHFKEFKTFVTAGLVVPVLIGAYHFYEDDLRAFLLSHDHINYPEFNAFRYLHAHSRGVDTMCSGCLRTRVRDVTAKYKGREGEEKHKDLIDRFISSMDPVPVADAAHIDQAIEYYKAGDLVRLRQLTKMSRVIEELRIGEEFKSPIILDDSDLASLPSGLTPQINEGRTQAARVEEMVANGLGIMIPDEMPVEAYIELVKDYQPKISKTIKKVLGECNASASIADVSKNIIAINGELERIIVSRRYTVLEACMGFYRNNSTLIGATLIAGALGFTGSLLGCVASGATGIGGQIARKKGWIKNSASTERLKKMITRDLQPIADSAMKAYFGSKSPAINVLSLRKTIAETLKAKSTSKVG